MEKHLYLYEGPVLEFGRVINDKYKNGTQAVSKEQAISNLKFNYKKANKLDIRNSKIDLDERYLSLDN